LNDFHSLSHRSMSKFSLLCRALSVSMILVTASSLSACDNKEKKPGQALARVNGEEITVLQVNDELSRIGVKADQQEVATKQLLESMIDRQLIIEEAMRNKIHRTPEVVQAIERAKTKIIEQAYIADLTAKISKPSKGEVIDYFQKHPEYFEDRKQYTIQQLIIGNENLREDLKSYIDSAKSLSEVAKWMDGHKLRYLRGQFSRYTSDLPEQIVVKLKDLQKGQLFVVNEGQNSLLNSISDVKNSPVTLKNAEPQIAQYLLNKKYHDMENSEITRLRSLAKIEYLNIAEPNVTQKK
jgi:peptidyl-prolyl cis-trans isomerase C